MAIGPIDYAMIQRTNDVEMYKMQEEKQSDIINGDIFF